MNAPDTFYGRDSDRLRWLMPCFDGLVGAHLDRYEYASLVAEERGNDDEPDSADHFNGFRRMIDEAMAAAERATVINGVVT